MRLDLTESPIEEAERCLDLGARGIKLHPRAQKFLLNDERLTPVFAVAAERRVPILIHGGRGLPPIAADLARLVDRYPDAQLIIAHAGIADLGNLMRLLAGQEGRLLRHLRLEPDRPARLLPPGLAGAGAVRVRLPVRPAAELAADRAAHRARVAGYDDDRIRDMLAGNANRIADGEEPLEPTAATGSDIFSQPMVLARIHQYLSMATPLLWTRQPDTVGVIGLALNACEENGDRAAPSSTASASSSSAPATSGARYPRSRTSATACARSAHTFRLIHLADIVAVTPGVFSRDESRSRT